MSMRIKLHALEAGTCFTFLGSSTVWQVNDDLKTASLVCRHEPEPAEDTITFDGNLTVNWLTEPEVLAHVGDEGYVE